MEVQEPISTTDRLRDFVARHGFNHNDRLPPERVLCQQFGVTRGALRKALAELEGDGLIWRHVGRGTFIGARPVLNLADVAYLGELASPAQVMMARLAIEEIQKCCRRGRTAGDWRSYEAWDNNLHYAIAKATHNKLLIYLFDILNVVRRSTVWEQPRQTRMPPAHHFSFDQHDAILEAVMQRDAQMAAARMRHHLESVRERALPALTP
jgi:DNA-binding FadR family transcriptional regulator